MTCVRITFLVFWSPGCACSPVTLTNKKPAFPVPASGAWPWEGLLAVLGIFLSLGLRKTLGARSLWAPSSRIPGTRIANICVYLSGCLLTSDIDAAHQSGVAESIDYLSHSAERSQPLHMYLISGCSSVCSSRGSVIHSILTIQRGDCRRRRIYGQTGRHYSECLVSGGSAKGGATANQRPLARSGNSWNREKLLAS